MVIFGVPLELFVLLLMYGRAITLRYRFPHDPTSTLI
jgi:hypothetical protein